ncbi:MAG TPA: peptidoglycan DD-metalloendopeptidase family protein [Candidatus Limnocylindrales bacterium]|nr:peptidoglycan DD-metalloendopeptidase family protein [Candidatus Limnocylindrales bacterium]
MSRNTVTQQFPRSSRGHRSRLLLALLVVPFMFGVIAAPAVAPGPVMGDELADAKAQQRQLEKKINEQKALIASINGSQNALEGKISATKGKLAGIAEDLGATRKRVAALTDDIEAVRAAYQSLVNNMSDLELQLHRIELQETDKRDQLRQRKAELATRIREAYEAERTSMLETFLSGASFTDMLTEMSTQLDAAEQDRALAQQIAQDRETLLSLHRTVKDTKAQTDVLRQETAVQKQKLDRRMEDLRKQQARLKALEKAAKVALAQQKAEYEKLAADKAKLRRAVAAAATARRALQKKIDKIIASQVNHGNIPSQYNGTLSWPMGGTVSQDFGCTGFSWEPANGGCSHWHNGIDIVAPYGTPVRASGAGRVVYCGWNYADGADPAWIVIIAHSSELTTWYAHMQSRCPARTGADVRRGQVIGYEGNTGHSTGAHLHWMVQFRGSFVNPRLFT